MTKTGVRRSTTKSRARLVLIELRTADEVELHYRQHLSKGAAYGPPGGKDRAAVSLMLVGPAATPLELAARTVYVGAEGTGYQLTDWGAPLRHQLEAWVAENTDPDAAERAPTTRMPKLGRARGPSKPPPVAEAPPPPAVAAPELEPEPDPAPDEKEVRIPLNVFERLRALPAVQQLKLAREGDLAERVALERMLGKTVWEPLLRNPKITPREVARIARMGSLPLPLLDAIVGNGAWLRAPEVRRALLANLRLSGDNIVRVLRVLPKHELRLVPLQTAYPPAVRDAARRLLPRA